MDLFRLVLRSMSGSPVRSWLVAASAFVLAGLALAAAVVLLGAHHSLRLTLDRLGADLVVVPEEAAVRAETALLTGRPARIWMPRSALSEIASVSGVRVASPQLYLATLENASCCTVQNMFMIVYDPHTDFVVRPWLKGRLENGLRVGQVVGGENVRVPPGEPDIKLYGYHVALATKMAPTGTGLDQTLFLSMDTAREMARVSLTEAERPLEVPEDRISAVLVKLEPGASPHAVALEIMERLPGMSAVVSPDLFRSYRAELTGLFGGVTGILVVTLLLTQVLIALTFTLAADARRRELGVLRALGASRRFVLRFLVLEAGLLAFEGGLVGVAFVLPALALFRRWIVVELGFPFLMPSIPILAVMALVVVEATLLSGALAALWPALRASRRDPAAAMRE